MKEYLEFMKGEKIFHVKRRNNVLSLKKAIFRLKGEVKE